MGKQESVSYWFQYAKDLAKAGFSKSPDNKSRTKDE